jgi:hypothetical protein
MRVTRASGSGTIALVMRSVIVSLFAVVAVLGASSTAKALQCGERLVEIGDAQAYVRSVCGEPSSATTRAETRTEWRTTGVAPHQVRTQVTITVQIDVWVYDWGPERFMEELRFEGGVLVSETPMGPGTARASRRERVDDEDDPGAVHHHRDAHGHRDARRHGDDE